MGGASLDDVNATSFLFLHQHYLHQHLLFIITELLRLAESIFKKRLISRQQKIHPHRPIPSPSAIKTPLAPAL